jgi:hypothetical protein
MLCQHCVRNALSVSIGWGHVQVVEATDADTVGLESKTEPGIRFRQLARRLYTTFSQVQI